MPVSIWTKVKFYLYFWSRKIVVSLMILSLAGTSFGNVFAQEPADIPLESNNILSEKSDDSLSSDSEENIEVSVELKTEDINESSSSTIDEGVSTPEDQDDVTNLSVEIDGATTSSSTNTDLVSTSTLSTGSDFSTTTEEMVEMSSRNKFKKDDSLSVEEQLTAVRQHLLSNQLPQVAIDRLNDFESGQTEVVEKDGIFKKIWKLVTGNSDQAKELREAKEFAKKEPFKVETFDGEINLSDYSQYEKDFSDAKEQGTFIQKMKNFIRDGEFFNSDFDGTEEKDNIISRSISPSKAIADISNDPEDYLAEGGEIVFSQSIKDQADILNNDPLSMLNFVRNEIEYIPYYGSKKGSESTLVEKAGNDIDQASLLIAMLRYSDIPARYQHVDAKIDVKTVNEWLGTDSATSSAQILSLNKIPYIIYTYENGQDAFFVIEHSYVEAYIPYGYSRGSDINDGGKLQWVAMDPSINAIYHEQAFDLIEYLNNDGFDIEVFFEDYIGGQYDDMEPLDAFKDIIETTLASNTPEYYPDLTYEEALVHSVIKKQNHDFIPGSLPFEVSANLETYDYIPSSLRHKIEFTVEDYEDNIVLNHTAYLSDLSDKELLLTSIPATSEDEDIIEGFETLYDVVPLSIVAVKPVIKINGNVIASSSSTTTLGQRQNYTMEFTIPTRNIGSSVESLVISTDSKKTIAGNTEAIALNTDRIVPFEARSEADIESSTEFLSDKVLYQTATDYLKRLQDSHNELAAITGGDFTHAVTKAVVNNGIEVTFSSGNPYSFEWKGLTIDAFSNVRYFYRFNDGINTNKKEFIAVFGLQSSHDESDIFEDNFEIESVATTKGLKMVSDGEFSGVSLVKINDSNEGDINSLDTSSTTKTIFHTAIGEGKTIYTPSEAVSYNGWDGLFYILIDFEAGVATYAIGEGLNGGYTTVVVQNWPSGLQQMFRSGLLPNLTGEIITPNSTTVLQGTKIEWRAYYRSSFLGTTVYDWFENKVIDTSKLPLGTVVLKTGYNTNDSVNVAVRKQQLGSKYVDYDADIISIADKYSVPADLLKAVVVQEALSVVDKKTGQRVFDPRSYRYEAHKDYDWYSGVSGSAKTRIESFPENRFSIGGTAIHGSVSHGGQVPSYSEYIKWSQHTSGYIGSGFDLSGNIDNNLTAQDLYLKNKDKFWQLYKGEGEDWNFTAQLLLASSYGLAQVMYDTALLRGFEPNSSGSARPITDLFKARASIELSAKHLHTKYSQFGNWTDTLLAYNGGGNVEYATSVMNRWNNGNGDFKLIVLEEN